MIGIQNVLGFLHVNFFLFFYYFSASTPKGRAIAPGSKLKTTPVRIPASVPRTATVSPTVGVAARKQAWNPPSIHIYINYY